MKIISLFFILLLSFAVQMAFADEIVEVTQADKEAIALDLEKEAVSGKHDKKMKKFLNKVAKIFKSSKSTDEVESETKKSDCVDCTRKKNVGNFFKKLGMAIGRGSAWVTTTTAKPLLVASGFITGAIEKQDKNQDLVALYTFFLNNQSEFDDLYLEAGTFNDMVELVLAKMEEITSKKSKLIMREFLLNLGLKKEIPEDISQFELSANEIAAIDPAKLNPDFINSHPAYQDIKPLIGEVTKQELMDFVTSGYFNKGVSIKSYDSAKPNAAELVGSLIGQVVVPRIALNVISSSLAGLYTAPVVAAQFGSAISAGICLQPGTQEKFESDHDVRNFCSYVINRSAYELVKGRARGYVSGKKFHLKLAEKIKKFKAKKAAKAENKLIEERNQLP